MFAQRLKQLRKEMGLTQVQFAQKFNVSNGAVGMWETGKREPDFETINRLAAFFHVTVDYLLGNVNEPFFYLDNERIMREINSHEYEEAPAPEGGRQISDREIMFALWGDTDEISQEDLEDVKRYAAFIKERKKNR